MVSLNALTHSVGFAGMSLDSLPAPMAEAAFNQARQHLEA